MFTEHLKSYKHSTVISFSSKLRRMIAAWHPPLGALGSKRCRRGLNWGRERMCVNLQMKASHSLTKLPNP